VISRRIPFKFFLRQLPNSGSCPKRPAGKLTRKFRAWLPIQGPQNAALLKGKQNKGIWRLKSGDYRIIYQIENDKLIVLIIRIGNRKDIYRAF
jgi:mRNA interferase RelE/StbE